VVVHGVWNGVVLEMLDKCLTDPTTKLVASQRVSLPAQSYEPETSYSGTVRFLT
jgi:hypothetical protein